MNTQLLTRSVDSEDEFWQVRAFLIDVESTAPPALNWDVRRWEGKYFYAPTPGWREGWRGQMWLTAQGQIVAVVHPEGDGDAYIQIHPGYRHLEPELVAWAEDNLAADDAAGVRTLTMVVQAYDAWRRQVLLARGFTQTPHGGMVRHLRLGAQPLPAPELAPGYTLRTTNPDDPDDCQGIADILNAAFNRTVHTAAEYQTFTRLAPSFRAGLDLVATAPDGMIAAYVGVPYEPHNRVAVFEPVCTHPAHQRKGLAKALMFHALHELRSLGAVHVMVGTGDMIPANRLYDSIGFTEAYREQEWRKEF